MLHTGAGLCTLAIVTGKGARGAGTRYEKLQMPTAQSVGLAIRLEPRCTHRCTPSAGPSSAAKLTTPLTNKQAKQEKSIRRKMPLMMLLKPVAAAQPANTPQNDKSAA